MDGDLAFDRGESLRGTRESNIICRMADEGIPIGAIARVMKKPFDDVSRLLSSAKQMGFLPEVPVSDWKPGSRRDDRSPSFSARVAAIGLLDDIDLIFRLRRRLGLTVSETRILVAIFASNGVIAKPTLHVQSVEDGLPDTVSKIVDVFVSKVRRKLSGTAIQIKTAWGIGYFMEPEAKAALRDIIETERQSQ